MLGAVLIVRFMENSGCCGNFQEAMEAKSALPESTVATLCPIVRCPHVGVLVGMCSDQPSFSEKARGNDVR